MKKPMTEKKKRIMKIIGIAVVVLLVAQMGVLGWFGGLGPFSFLHKMRMNNLAGNKPEYDFSAIEQMENSPMEGKSIAILGSSVARGEASGEYAVGEYLAARLGCTLAKETVSGTTLVDNGESSYIRRMVNNMDTSAHYDLFICQLSTNDATKKMPLGNVSDSKKLEDFDTSTITGAMEYIICYAQENWSCPVVFFTGSRYDSSDYGAMVQSLYALQEKWGIGILDLWTDDTFNSISTSQRNIYMSDFIHPTRAGYRDWWGPEQEKQLLSFLGY